jgi:hypothetical protein
MLCNRCQSIDFSGSPLHSEVVIGFHGWDGLSYKPSDGSGKFFACEHHPSIEDLVLAAEEGCHVCIQIRHGLWWARGHESNEVRHRGPIEIRYYQQTPKSKNGVEITELFAVAKTPARDVKVTFDFVQYPCQSALVLLSLSERNRFLLSNLNQCH